MSNIIRILYRRANLIRLDRRNRRRCLNLEPLEPRSLLSIGGAAFPSSSGGFDSGRFRPIPSMIENFPGTHELFRARLGDQSTHVFAADPHDPGRSRGGGTDPIASNFIRRFPTPPRRPAPPPPRPGINVMTFPTGTTEGSSLPSYQGTGRTLVAAFVGSPFVRYSSAINWGDGTSSPGVVYHDPHLPRNVFLVLGSHSPYAEETTYHDTVIVVGGGRFGVGGGTIQIGDAPLSSSGVSALSLTQGQTFSGTVATFRDAYLFEPGGPSDYSATINWGNGVVTAGTISAARFAPGTYIVTGANSYMSPGSYTIDVTIRDDGGSSTSVSDSADVTSPPPSSSHFVYALGVGSTKMINVAGVATSASGDVYVVGTFSGAASFGPYHSITSSTITAIFVAEFSPSGGWQWATAIDPGSSLSEYRGDGIVVDQTGQVDIVGNLTGSGIPSQSIVAQLNPTTGALNWLDHFTPASSGSSSTASGIAADTEVTGSFNLDVVGSFVGTINVGGVVLTSPSPSDEYVSQISESGIVNWASSLPGTTSTSVSGSGITVDNVTGDIFTVGTSYSLLSSSILVSEFDSKGVFVASVSPAPARYSQGTGITVDGHGDLYVTGGAAFSPFAFNPAIVAKLDESNLSTIWLHGFGALSGSSSAVASGVAVDSSGDPYITGGFYGSIDFGSGAFFTSRGSSDVFVAKLDPTTGLLNGTPSTWATTAGGAGYDSATGIAFSTGSSNAVFIVGAYTPPAKFGYITLGSQGNQNVFLSLLT